MSFGIPFFAGFVIIQLALITHLAEITIKNRMYKTAVFAALLPLVWLYLWLVAYPSCLRDEHDTCMVGLGVIMWTLLFGGCFFLLFIWLYVSMIVRKRNRV